MSACLGLACTQPTGLLVFCSRHRGCKSAKGAPAQRQAVSPRATHHLCSNQHRHRLNPPPSSEAVSGHTSTAGSLEAVHEQEQQDDGAQEQHSPWLLKQHLSECPVCSGTGRCLCKDCAGSGFLQRGGYSKKNPLNLSRAVGSKWTAMVTTLGWRHFRVIAVRKLDKHKHNTYLLMQASCDSSQQLWVNALTLRNRSCWAAGWLQMSELVVLAEGVAPSTGHKCHSCAGLGYRACSACDGKGRAELVEIYV